MTPDGLPLASTHRSKAAMGTMTAALRRAGLPLISYYGVTVLVPLANGAGHTGRAFLEHITFVLLAPLAFVVLVAWFGHIGRKGARKISALVRERR